MIDPVHEFIKSAQLAGIKNIYFKDDVDIQFRMRLENYIMASFTESSLIYNEGELSKHKTYQISGIKIHFIE